MRKGGYSGGREKWEEMIKKKQQPKTKMVGEKRVTIQGIEPQSSDKAKILTTK